MLLELSNVSLIGLPGALRCQGSEGTDNAVANPRRAQSYKFELFELVLLLRLGKRFPVEPFEASVSRSTAPSPPLTPVRELRRCALRRCALRSCSVVARGALRSCANQPTLQQACITFNALSIPISSVVVRFK